MILENIYNVMQSSYGRSQISRMHLNKLCTWTLERPALGYDRYLPTSIYRLGFIDRDVQQRYIALSIARNNRRLPVSIYT